MPERPMAKITTTWEQGYRFRSKDAWGHELVLDAPTSEGAPFEGFKPAQALLAALAACSGIDVVSILQKKRQRVTGLEINVTGYQRVGPPTPWEEVQVEYVVRGGNVDPDAVKRAIQLSEEKYCTVGATIKGVAKIVSTFRVVQDEEAAKAA